MFNQMLKKWTDISTLKFLYNFWFHFKSCNQAIYTLDVTGNKIVIKFLSFCGELFVESIT